MRYFIFCFVSLLLLATKCEKNTENGENDYDSLRIIFNQYPSKTKKVYQVSPSKVKVSLTNKSLGMDSTLYEKRINWPKGKISIVQGSSFDKDIYKNKCVEDGMIIHLEYEKSDSIIRVVRFTNVYHSALDSIITFVNQEIDSTNQISYNKSYLIELERSCD